MKVVWSDDAVWALVALETRLAQRYSSNKAARIVEDLWFAASIDWRIIRNSAVSYLNTGSGSCASWSIGGTACCTGCAPMPSKS